jgi:hypothetical protein
MLMNAKDMDTDELIALLRLGTSELYYIRASVELIARHRYWLERPDFRQFVEIFPSDDTGTSAGIWLEKAADALDRGELPADMEQANVLRMAASLATFYHVSLRDVSERLSPETMKIAAEAIMWAGGYTESTAEVRL